jgi:hypothetical protein
LPCYKTGWSLGGVVAFKITKRLTQHGVRVHSIILIDSPCPDKHMSLSSMHVFALCTFKASFELSGPWTNPILLTTSCFLSSSIKDLTLANFPVHESLWQNAEQATTLKANTLVEEVESSWSLCKE